MNVQKLSIPDVLLITPQKFADERGFFSETWNADKLKAHEVPSTFVQDNQSFSAQKGTVRGLHCQTEPYAQGKLVRVLRGAIWDVAVDIRQGSPTYGQWVAAELSVENWTQIWIPCGFLHGFCALVPNTEVLYKVTASYAKDCERSVRWNDPALALPWPVGAEEAVLSDKDREAPLFNPQDNWFQY
ncbi:dTDP-4-dehydrorhamnose 3,5-epimerase [Acetobacter ghanensis]|uniref:dTDP-4-dehydrorhamnose 3,5-epimerase n=1 Tax=Acetobacter ghanensis TaxID=431306 RepID=A0ABX0KMT9_9PROT|nr:dTDP-4-dehydrorhamnose 3,5-epimerase [Acetobacter ghanensis]NHO39693.1 dTDP-4-dehydrorhamnose 3,5-epimerase [Acetobacter ghanensis]GBQ48938.1 dTDP-4-dehydrorhamnose 3,5-epimerase [Acetobacter ghanensis DSM 18895]